MTAGVEPDGHGGARAERRSTWSRPTSRRCSNEIDGQTTKGSKSDRPRYGRRRGHDRRDVGLWKRILDTIIDPNIITLLLSLGVLAITVELFNPGLIFPAAFGVDRADHRPLRPPGASVQLGRRAAHARRVRVLHRRGVHHEPRRARGGRCSRPSSSARSCSSTRPATSYQVSLPVAIAIAAVFVAAGRLRAHEGAGRPQATAAHGQRRAPRRRSAWFARALAPEGLVFVHGELWRARSTRRGDGRGRETPVKVEAARRGSRARGRPRGRRCSAGTRASIVSVRRTKALGRSDMTGATRRDRRRRHPRPAPDRGAPYESRGSTSAASSSASAGS